VAGKPHDSEGLTHSGMRSGREWQYL
jgi:hypothetical protein